MFYIPWFRAFRLRTAESESVRLNAAEAILSRGWGRPALTFLETAATCWICHVKLVPEPDLNFIRPVFAGNPGGRPRQLASVMPLFQVSDLVSGQIRKLFRQKTAVHLKRLDRARCSRLRRARSICPLKNKHRSLRRRDLKWRRQISSTCSCFSRASTPRHKKLLVARS
jgi:hypothetical protein